MKVHAKILAPAVVAVLLLQVLAPSRLRAQESVTFAGAGCGTAWLQTVLSCSSPNSSSCTVYSYFWDVNFLNNPSSNNPFWVGLILNLGTSNLPIPFPLQIQSTPCLLHAYPDVVWPMSGTIPRAGAVAYPQASIPRYLFPIRIQALFWEFSTATSSGYVSLTPAWELRVQ